MRVAKINSTMSKLQKPFRPIKRKTDNLMQKCQEIRHKHIKDLTVKEAPYLGALMGLFTPIPFGFLLGFGIGKLVEFGANLFNKNKTK